MPTYIARSKRTRIIYVVLLCVAMVMATWAVYNQVASDNTASDLASQVNSLCHNNPDYAKAQGLNCQQAKDVESSTVSIKGDKGDKGETGLKGDTGASGISVTGPVGAVGQKGDKGDPGTPGKDGASVTGPSGAQGDEGPSGPKGDKGDKGDRGSDGAPAPQVSAIDFVGTPSDCRFIITFTDASQVSTPVRGDLCI